MPASPTGRLRTRVRTRRLVSFRSCLPGRPACGVCPPPGAADAEACPAHARSARARQAGRAHHAADGDPEQGPHGGGHAAAAQGAHSGLGRSGPAHTARCLQGRQPCARAPLTAAHAARRTASSACTSPIRGSTSAAWRRRAPPAPLGWAASGGRAAPRRAESTIPNVPRRCRAWRCGSSARRTWCAS